LKVINLKYFILFLLFGIILVNFYRPYIYNNKIYDFGLADVGNNIFFIPCVYFMILFFYKKNLFGKYKDIFFHFIFLTFFEILSKYFEGFGTYDLNDIFALFIGSVLTYLIVKFEESRNKKNI
jgi:hypothetical protein